jgi:hypothetical protein
VGVHIEANDYSGGAEDTSPKEGFNVLIMINHRGRVMNLSKRNIQQIFLANRIVRRQMPKNGMKPTIPRLRLSIMST